MRSRDSSDDSRTFTEQARRAQIVRCAMEVIAEIGYGRTTIRKIADRVGVAMSVVLYHFSNKDALTRAILTEAILSVVEVVAPAMDAEPTATGKLRAYLRSNAAFLQAHPMTFAVMLDIGTNYRSAEGKRIDQLELDPELLLQFARLDLQATLRLGRDTREFRPLDSKNMATAISSALNGAVLEIARDPDFDAIGYGELLITVFDSALAHSDNTEEN